MPIGRFTLRGPRASFLALAAALAACAGSPSLTPLPAPPAAALEAFELARSLRGAGADARDPRLWEALAEARRLAPDWIAPARLEDDLLVGELRQVEAIERRRQALAESPGDVRAAYLERRLSGERDPDRYAPLVAAAPDLAWVRHAHAWTLSSEGPIEAVEAEWRAALALARTPWEAAHFGRLLAAYLIGAGRKTRGFALYDELLHDLALGTTDRAALTLELAISEMRDGESARRELGYERGLSLLRAEALSPSGLRRLFDALQRTFVLSDAGRERFELALASHESELRQELLAEFWLSRGERAFVRGLARSSGATAISEQLEGQVSLDARLRGGEPGRGLDEWLGRQPSQVLASDGLPADDGLREVVLAARGIDANSSSATAWSRLGEAFLAVGWYSRAGTVAQLLAEAEFATAFELRRRAVAGRALFRSLQELLEEVEGDVPERALDASWEPPILQGDRPPIGSLEDLLQRWGQAFAQAATSGGTPTSEGALREILAASPVQSYGPFALLVHPGPRFSRADEAAGIGAAGEAVPGLAHEMLRRGRFAVLGEVLGDKPDATVLRVLHIEELAGEHLGVPWRGTVVWCDGIDVESRAQRLGTHIGGAAVHEGYWVDLEQVRLLHDHWTRTRARFDGAPSDTAARQRVERALATRGLRLRYAPALARQRRRERRAISPPLGQAERMRLAVLAERAQPGRLLGELQFEEVVDLIATHEEGHLCDRTRFLPLSSGLGSILHLLVEEGFSALRVQTRLEYRAELTALCEVADPRLALVDLLLAAESDLAESLGHGPAYRQLLSDVLGVLDDELEIEPEAWPELSPDHTLLHQLHHLPPEKLRKVARELARREGLLS